MTRIVMFDTTHHALWAEEIARAQGFEIEIVPAPESADAKCGMALEVQESDFAQLKDALVAQGISFKESGISS